MNLLNFIVPYKVVIPDHRIDPEHNAAFDVKQKTKRFFSQDSLNNYLMKWEERSQNNVRIINPEVGGMELATAYVKFQRGVTEGKTTYALITSFAGDWIGGEPYPQLYTTIIAEKYSTKFSELKN